MKQIMLYGISGPSKAYSVLNWYEIYEEDVSIRAIQDEARRLVMKNPSVTQVYAIDNRRGLKRDFRESMRQNSIESHYIFKDILEREGMRIL